MSSNLDCTPKGGEFRRGIRRKTVPNALELRAVKSALGMREVQGLESGLEPEENGVAEM